VKEPLFDSADLAPVETRPQLPIPTDKGVVDKVCFFDEKELLESHVEVTGFGLIELALPRVCQGLGAGSGSYKMVVSGN
jgi:hypothetical protein